MEFLESGDQITSTLGSSAGTTIEDTCASYDTYDETAKWPQDDSGI